MTILISLLACILGFAIGIKLGFTLGANNVMELAADVIVDLIKKNKSN